MNNKKIKGQILHIIVLHVQERCLFDNKIKTWGKRVVDSKNYTPSQKNKNYSKLIIHNSLS